MKTSEGPAGLPSADAPSAVPEPYPKRPLLCITGLTPQVITETLFSLAHEDSAQLPTEVHVLSTTEGIQRARLMLLTEQPGWFRRLCQDYRLPPTRFDEDTLHVLCARDGQPLEDIRNEEDSQAAADGITEWVRRYTEDQDSQLHVSLAGGRKTMGFFAGYALSLYGRRQDRLSHVLVDAPFESHPGFFYPTPYSHVIYAPPPDQRPLDARHARVTLASLPFVRLRDGLPERLLSGRATFSETVAAAQRVLQKPVLVLDVRRRKVVAGGDELMLAPADFAFYLWFARRRLSHRPGVHWSDHGLAAEYLDTYQQACGEWADTDRVAAALQRGMNKEWFEQRKSKTNKALIEALGETVARPYLVSGDGKRPRTRFGLMLDPDVIRIVGAAE